MSKELLQKACELYSQREVARRINRSPTSVNLILNDKYPKPKMILSRVDKEFSYLNEESVMCPILGDIHLQVCSRYQRWNNDNVVNPDRLYIQVKEHCIQCEVLRKK